MRYDVSMKITYLYERMATLGRHCVYLLPQTEPGEQTVLSRVLTVTPQPVEMSERLDFFGNPVTDIAFDGSASEIRFQIRARVDRPQPGGTLDISPPIGALRAELAEYRNLGPRSPHHFTAPSRRVPFEHDVTEYARSATRDCRTVRQAVEAVGRALNADMTFDAKATTVDTPLGAAFVARHGVCQDFSHIMISALRSIGIPAGYVSGFLRTNPPPGRPRLEGADAMHAWVMAWCGVEMGWVEYDPTNAIYGGPDHIVIARGRDYSDVSPVTGVTRLVGKHRTKQEVDVVPLDGPAAP